MTNKKEQNAVLLVHGFGGKKFWMQPLATRLRRNFQVHCFSYPTLFLPVETHANNLLHWLDRLNLKTGFHIVAHSMGSIVVRSAMTVRTITNLNRFVMLAPPNHGSPVAGFLANFVGQIFTPLNQLSTDSNSYVNNLSNALPCESGIIAARFDALVPIPSTTLSTTSEHVVLHQTHNSLLFSRQAARLTTRFLNNGSFHNTFK